MDLFCLRLISFCFFLDSLNVVFGYSQSYECGHEYCNMFCQDEDLTTALDYRYDKYGYRRGYYFNITINRSNTNELGTDIFEHYPLIKILKISNTHITVLLPGVFSKLEKATDLYITHNDRLRTIKSSVFSTMPNLQRLDLSFNNISFIDEHALYNLQKLKYFILSHNKITYVYASLLAFSKNLNYFDFSYNKIISIEGSALDNLPLETLYLQNNFLTNMSSICSHISQKIQHLDLSNNQIEDYDTCLQLTNLEMVKLISSNLSDVDFLNEGFDNLQVLDLSGNNIEEIGHTLTHLKELQILNLSTNKIRVLPIGCFSNLTKLQHLNLSHNEVDEIQLGVFQDLTSVTNKDFLNSRLKSLQVIDLSDNNIRKIDHIFPHIENLQILILSHNKLQKLQLGLFQELSTVINLTLSNNAIQVLSVGCFANLHNLQYLNLSYNNISELQLGVFQDLSNLVYLDLSFNNLTSLYESCFYVLKKLETLKVDNNHIAVIDVDILTRGKQLTQISIDNNDWKCKVLAEIIVKFEHHNVSIENTLVRGKKNIHGITCGDESATVKPTEIFHSGKTTNNTSIKPQLVVPNLEKFDENFKKTAFFDMANKISNGNLLDVKKFDDNFKNTEFYNFIKDDLMNNNFSAIMKRFDGAFANTLVYKSLQKEFLIKKLEEFALKNVNESALDVDDKNGEEMRLQKYLDDGFRNSTFYKYFEQFSENNNRVDAQKLVQDEKNMDYSKHIYTLLIFVVLLLTIIVLILLYEKYQNYGSIKFNTNRNDDTASGILMT